MELCLTILSLQAVQICPCESTVILASVFGIAAGSVTQSHDPLLFNLAMKP